MTADLEREALAMLVRGFVTPADVAAVPSEALTTDARLLAWTCACRAVRLLGRDLQRARVNGRGVYLAREGRPFDVVRHALTTAPMGDAPHDAWAELAREAHEELDHAERVDTFDPLTVRKLTTTKETTTCER